MLQKGKPLSLPEKEGVFAVFKGFVSFIL